MGNNIDDIFKRAVEPLDTEPSEEFWRKAAEDIIAKGSQATEKRVFRWRATAFILGAGLLILGYFTYKMQGSLEHANEQMKVVENEQNKQTNKLVENNIDKDEEKTTLKTIASKNNLTGKKQNEPTITRGTREYHPVVASHTMVAINNSNQKSGSNLQGSYVNTNQAKIKVVTNYKKPVVNAASPKPVDIITSSVNQNNHTIVSVANNVNNNQEDNSAQTKAIVFVPQSSQTENSAIDKNNASDTATYAVQNDQTINGLPPLSNTTVVNKLQGEDTVSRLSISAYFSPDYLVGYGFSSPYSWGTQIENSIKQHEKEKFSYTTGVKVEYALSANFSIGAGIAYEEYSFNVDPTVIHAQRQSDGDIGYYFTTSSGIVQCPSYGHTTLTDSIKMNASSNRKYLQVPLLAKYYVVNTKKLRLYVIGGVEPCFSLGMNTTMNWQNFWGEGGTVSANSVEGSRNLYFSYYVGVGVTYKAGKHLSIYVEPGLHNAVTPIDDQIAVTTSPSLFSASVGLTYTLK